MMTVNWYKVGNLDEFQKKSVPQEEKVMELEDMGQVQIVLLQGINFSIIFNGECLTPMLNGRNPFFRNQTTAFIHPETKDIWVGYEVNL